VDGSHRRLALGEAHRLGGVLALLAGHRLVLDDLFWSSRMP
jgi:hypothetical protein